MKTIKQIGVVSGIAAALMLGACATPNNNSYPSSSAPASSSAYSGYGVVQSIELVRQDASNNNRIGLGTVAGAIVGGVVGNQIGEGKGNTAATVAGAAGGAYAGHQIEKNTRGGGAASDAYRVSVRMDDGSYQTVLQASDNGLRPGDRVRISNGVAVRY